MNSSSWLLVVYCPYASPTVRHIDGVIVAPCCTQNAMLLNPKSSLVLLLFFGYNNYHEGDYVDEFSIDNEGDN